MRFSAIILAAAIAAVPVSLLAAGASRYAPGHRMQNQPTQTSASPGASRFAPGHETQNSRGGTRPGASSFAPGRKMNHTRVH